MTTRKFLTSVADVYGYNTDTDELVFTGKTLLDSSMEVSLGSAPVRGGRGNQLQYIYYHTGEMKFTLTDTQWNLQMIGATVGDDVSTNTNAYEEVNVTLTSASGAALATGKIPLSYSGTGTVYGWATTHSGASTYRVVFTSGSPWTFQTVNGESLGTTGENVCVRYYTEKPSATYITVNANMIPKVVKLVMETQLNSADVTSNKIGVVQIIAPTVTLSGAFTISMKSDGVSNTPLTATALAYTGSVGSDACLNEPYYAKIVEILTSSNWWDNVIGLSIAGGDFNMATSACSTLQVWAIPSTGAAFRVPSTGSGVTYAVVATGLGAVGMTCGSYTGTVYSGSTAGSGVVNAYITAASTIDASVMIFVS